MSKYTVDSEAVQAASASIRGVTEQLRADVNTLMGQIQNLQSQWTGQAASAFTAAAHDWRTTQARVEESINELNMALAQAGTQYADVEMQNAGMFGR
ncbi:WXG100 family type VII secretion target [Paramicrobacterium fandaimingii]|uniref:WXG100 family type VII secretion target n=1 Tax=Paramicrobacterium fandaimingii TaxID=2708079 RepID=UPI001423C1D5|nr:WXG100 family type VII secretion target [Microbacterium fandaimingii]